jgi:transcriptional antiterminator RfaH
MLKESQNPPTIWPQDRQLEDFQGKWWVIHTKSRNEKALAWQMMKKEINYFLPMRWKVRQTRGRKVRSLLPLFTGYSFFCGNEKNRIEILKTNRVANLIEVKNPRKLINDLKPIDTMIRNGEDIQPEDNVPEGTFCRVIAGPLMGTTGVVINKTGRRRLVLQVEMLGQAASVEIDSDMVEPIND